MALAFGMRGCEIDCFQVNLEEGEWYWNISIVLFSLRALVTNKIDFFIRVTEDRCSNGMKYLDFQEFQSMTSVTLRRIRFIIHED
jgi:hypothetical protein